MIGRCTCTSVLAIVSIFAQGSTDSCSEIGFLASLDACNFGASSDRREPISLHQAVDDEAFTVMSVGSRI